MKNVFNVIGVSLACFGLAACGSSTKETVIHEQPIVQERVVHEQAPAAPAVMSPSSVESNCAHGYDNKSHSCY